MRDQPVADAHHDDSPKPVCDASSKAMWCQRTCIGSFSCRRTTRTARRAAIELLRRGLFVHGELGEAVGGGADTLEECPELGRSRRGARRGVGGTERQAISRTSSAHGRRRMGAVYGARSGHHVQHRGSSSSRRRDDAPVAVELAA